MTRSNARRASLVAILLACSISSASLAAPKNGAERQELAKLTMRFLEPIYRALPTLSPAERSWVEQELKAATGPGASDVRLTNLTRSREYQIRTARRWFDPAHISASALIAGKTPSKRFEVLLWAQLMEHLMENDAYWSLDRLVERGVLSASLVRGDTDVALFLRSVVVSSIISDIIIPYLANDLPD